MSPLLNYFEKEIIMDILHHSGHHDLPHVRHVAWNQSFQWLGQGLVDLFHHPTLSLSFGACFTLAGVVMFALAQTRPELLLAAVSGFLLVGPLLAVGFYEISRRTARDEPVGLFPVFRSLGEHWRPLALFGVFLAMIYFVWAQLTTALVAYLLGNEWIWGFEELVHEVFFPGLHPKLAALWTLSGATLAAVTFLVSVVTAPLLLEREVEVHHAMATSVHAVMENLPAMLVWAFMIVALTFFGFVTLMAGLVVIMPLLGHATWHAYKDLVE
jgi:uncharacterized membrane protein